MIKSFSGQVVFCFAILRAISAYVGENWLSQDSFWQEDLGYLACNILKPPVASATVHSQWGCVVDNYYLGVAFIVCVDLYLVHVW